MKKEISIPPQKGRGQTGPDNRLQIV